MPTCAAGERLACTNLIDDLQMLEAPPEELRPAMELACRAKAPKTCASAGDGIKAMDPMRARELFEIGCELGEDIACRNAEAAGSLWVFDHRQARCTAGELVACDALGELLANPASPRFSPDRARPLLMDACRRVASACRALGQLEVGP